MGIGSKDHGVTLPKTNSKFAPKNDGFPIGISFSSGFFSGAMLVSGRVFCYTIGTCPKALLGCQKAYRWSVPHFHAV